MEEQPGSVPGRTSRRAAEPLLQLLHGEGEAEDEDRGVSRGSPAGRELNGPVSRRSERLDTLQRQRRNVNGINASTSPRRKSETGPRTARSNSISPGERLVLIHAAKPVDSLDPLSCSVTSS